VPVLVINADPDFDLPAVVRRDGLDLFESDRLILVDARDDDPDLQRERLWADWPVRLENNRSNLLAEIVRFLATAKRDDKTQHIILFILDEFEPDDTGKLISKEFLEEINERIDAQDKRNNRASLTRKGQSNVWMVAYVRAIYAAEDVAERAWRANVSGYVNTIFVSAFDGMTADRATSDFLTIRVLAETLLKESDNRRFLQRNMQNSYPATCVIGPDTLPSDSASHFIRAALQRTLTTLEQRGASGAGSQVISQQAEGLKKLAEDLVEQARHTAKDAPTVDPINPDLEIGRILSFVTSRSRLRPVWRNPDNFKKLRDDIRIHIGNEQHNINHMRSEWAQHRRGHLKDFAGINVRINETIDELSRAAVSSRGNDVRILEDLIKSVHETVDDLKSTALELRGSMAASTVQPAGASNVANEKIEGMLRALEFEFDHVPQRRAIGLVLAVSLTAALAPLLLQFATALRNHDLHVLLAILFPVLVFLVTSFALVRRQAKLKQAAVHLREAMDEWRADAFKAFDEAMRYQTCTLAIGWLDSMVERLQRIKESIRKRGEALEACLRDLGDEILLTSSGTGRDLNSTIAEGVRQLQTDSWDTWISTFLRMMAKEKYGAKPAEVELRDDEETIAVSVSGFVEIVRIGLKTPPAVMQLAAAARPPETPGEATAGGGEQLL
jgi:hypothetical protein